jgi:endonuclease YncB( thermonuclease family)
MSARRLLLALPFALVVAACLLASQPTRLVPAQAVGTPVSVTVRGGSCEVIDGDTLRVEMRYEFSARLFGVDAPEISKPEQAAAAKVVKQAVADWLKNADNVRVNIIKNDKFGGRYLCDVVSDSGSLSDFLLFAKLVKPYRGDKKAEWATAELKAIEQWTPPR